MPPVAATAHHNPFAASERVEKVEISNAGLEFARLKSGMASKTPASIDTKKRR